jgi:hypothetical protein
MSRRLLYLVAAAVLAAILAVVFVQWRGIPGQTRPHQDVGIQAQALRSTFNAANGTVRIVMVVSPTCGACLRGAADIQTDVFDTIDSPDLRGFVVWVPKLNGHENDVDEATHTISDTRVTHYWDGNGYLVDAYNDALDLGQDAWDIYLLYGPDARWDDTRPPAPLSWMHQLSDVDHPTFDAATLAAQTRAELA